MNFHKLTDPELRMWIAERLGWTDLRVNKTYPTLIMGTPPDAKVDRVYAVSDIVTVTHQNNIPNWPGDLISAVALFEGYRDWDMIRRGFSYWTVVVYALDGDELLRTVAVKLSRAVAVAWAMMKEAEADGHT